MRQFRILHYMLLCLTLLCLGACGDDEDAVKNNSAIKDELQSKKWICYTSDAGSLSKESYTLYFIDDSHGVERWTQRYLDIGGSYKERSYPFRYSINGNKINITYNGNTSEYIYGGDYLSNGSYLFSPYALDDGDYEYMKDYDPAEEERKENTEDIVKSKVSVEVEKEDVVWYYTFKTSLHKEFPYSDIQYGARIRSYDKGHWHEIYVTEEGEGNICEMHVYAVKFHSENDYKKACAEYVLFKQQYDAVKVIIDNGTASESEKSLYKSLKEILKDLKDINFQAEPIVCIDGEVYELE